MLSFSFSIQAVLQQSHLQTLAKENIKPEENSFPFRTWIKSDDSSLMMMMMMNKKKPNHQSKATLNPIKHHANRQKT